MDRSGVPTSPRRGACRLAPQEALDCSRVEENFQIAEWGLVEGAEGHEGDVADLHARVIASSLFVRLLRLQ